MRIGLFELFANDLQMEFVHVDVFIRDGVRCLSCFSLGFDCTEFAIRFAEYVLNPRRWDYDCCSPSYARDCKEDV